MPKFKLILEYDGTEFAGWQRQAPPNNVRTVQEEIERALHAVFHEPVDVVGAGRTDAGVHARGQVAHVVFQRENLVAEEIQRALIGILPRDIVCRSTELVPADFHARYSATRRTYVYSVTMRPLAIGRMYTWRTAPLDIQVMRQAAAVIMGAHDFTAYSKENAEIKNRRCTVVESVWTETEHGLRYLISADRFVYSMVRALVGAMVGVGRGRMRVDEFASVLESRDRGLNRNALAPSRGLCLQSVEY